MKKYVEGSKINESESMQRADYIEDVAFQVQQGFAHLPDAAEIEEHLRKAYREMSEIEYLLKHHD